MVLVLLPSCFVVYSITFAITGVHLLAVFVSLSFLVAVYLAKLPKSSQAQSDDVLQTSISPIIAHRGAGHDAPENTLGAIRLAKQNGAHAIEFDLAYTSDNKAVIIHDDTLDRTTNGTGQVKHITFDRLRKLNASTHDPKIKQFPNEVIPSLEEVVDLCLELDLNMYIDVKANATKTAEVVEELFKSRPELYRKALVCSFNPLIVYLVKRADPRITTGLTHQQSFLTRKVDGTDGEGPWWQKLLAPLADVVLEWAYYSWLWYLCGNSVALLYKGDVSQRVVDHFRDRDIATVVWTVNNPVEKRYLTSCLNCPCITDTLVTETTGQPE